MNGVVLGGYKSVKEQVKINISRFISRIRTRSMQATSHQKLLMVFNVKVGEIKKEWTSR